MMPRPRQLIASLAPVLIAMAFVLFGFSANAVPIDILWRPLMAVTAAAAALTLGAVITAGWLRGAFWAAVIVSVLTGMIALAGALVFALALFGFLGTRPGREYVLATMLTAAVGTLLAGAALLSGVRQGAFDWTPLATERLSLDGASVGPSIHVLLLDGYPRRDVLATVGFDNGPFLEALSQRGFDVYEDSHSNYDRTPFSILTMLSARHLTDIEALWTNPRPDGLAQEERLVARALLDTPALDALEDAGYRTRVMSGPVVHAPIGHADVEVGAGTANNFELDLLQDSPLAGALELAGFAAGQQRAQVSEVLAEFADPPEQATFTFAHVMAPHAPFVFNADGSPAGAPPCYPATCSIFQSDVDELGWTEAEYLHRLLGQIEHLNDLVLEALDDLVDRDPTAIVVVLSDHGIRMAGDPNALFRNLLVARTPGEARLLGEAPTPVNILPSILNAYLGASLSTQPDSRYQSGTDPWLAVERVGP
jgi:hypothetical protein